MFENILLPLPSEYYPQIAVKRALDLASRFKSEITLQYIFEKQLMDKVDNVSAGAVPYQSLKEMEREMKKVELNGESEVLFDRIEKFAQKRGVKLNKLVCSGTQTKEILKTIEKNKITLAITEFHKEAVLKYRFLYESPIPVWIEHSGKKLEKIFGILTNLSPNKLVPAAAFNLSKKFGLPLKFYYVHDSSEPLEDSEEDLARKELLIKLKNLRIKFKINFEFDVVFQEIGSFLNYYFKKERSGLVILGRFKKPTMLPFFNLDRKIEVSKKLGANVLILR